MNFKNNFLKKIIFSLFVLFSFVGIANASITNGTIDPSNYIAKFLDEGSRINFGYFSSNPTYDVHVTDSGLTGYAFGENVGWINMYPSASYHVTNDGYGNLAGYAFGENTGWINFKSTTANSAHKVVISSTGAAGFSSSFSGYAWSENYGWIQFDCAVVSACVKTDWVSISLRPRTTSSPFVPPVVPVVPPVVPITPIVPVVPPVAPIIPSDPVQPPPVSLPPNTTPGTPPGVSVPIPSTPPPTFINILTTPTIWPDIIKKSIDVFKTPAGDTVAKVITTVGVAVGAVASITAALFVNPLSFSELFLLPLRLWSLLLVAFGLKKRNRPWGTVYDSVTKQPLDPAYVVLQDENGKDVATSITDLDGRYAFLVKPGIYTILASKTNHVFPSKNLAGQERDEIYGDLYFGGKIIIENEEEVIKKNIPMDPISFDWNEFAKKDKSLMTFYSKNDIAAERLSRILFIIGFVVAGMALWAAPRPYNIAIFGLYILLLILREFGLKPPALGAVMEKETGFPLSFAVVRIYSTKTNIEVTKRIADERGRYHCLMSQGTYYVSIEKKNADQTYTKVLTSEPFETKSGIINKTFEV